MSPLFLASQNGEARVSQVLLEAGADPNFQYPQLQKQTPLIVATANELTNVVKVLLKVMEPYGFRPGLTHNLPVQPQKIVRFSHDTAHGFQYYDSFV